jgi:hypothetical protein
LSGKHTRQIHHVEHFGGNIGTGSDDCQERVGTDANGRIRNKSLVEKTLDCTAARFPAAKMAFRSGMQYNKESKELRLDDLPQEEWQLVQWVRRRI